MDKKETSEMPAVGNGPSSVDNEDSHPPEAETTAEEDEVSRKVVSLVSSEGEVPMKMKIFRIVVSVMLVVTGSVNTLAAKWADEIVINGRHFSHPFFQASVMFVGEICCLAAFFIVHYIRLFRWKRRHQNVVACEEGQKSLPDFQEMNEKNDLKGIDGETIPEYDLSSRSIVSAAPRIPRFNYFLFAIPAFCDVFATSIQYLGLTLTSASAYQMLRGAVIIFTGLFSMLFLHLKLYLFKWIGMLLVVIGLVIVGVADILYSNDTEDLSRLSVLAGDLLIIFAQVIVATQMVLEQKLLCDFDCPALLAVGLEGVFGFTILAILMIPMYFIHVSKMFSNSPEYRLEDALDAFQEMHDSGELVGALCLTVVSIAFFNFSGLSVTKYMSATTRMVLDSVRTIIIWAVSIPLFHSNFIPLQVLGFVFLIFGMFVYNDVVIGPQLRKTKCGAMLYPMSSVH